MTFVARTPNIRREIAKGRVGLSRDLRRAAIVATDRASREGRVELQARIRSVGLGKLGNAVGQTSTKRRGGAGDPYGVWFARGGDNSLAGGALEAYSRGTTIRPVNGNWLWIPTKAIQRRIRIGSGRYRLTPARWIGSALEQTVGKLVFRLLSPTRAILVVQNVSISTRTGRAKAPGKRRSKTQIPTKEIIAFTGIKVTRRAKRFDKDQIAQAWSRRVPGFIADELDSPAPR